MPIILTTLLPAIAPALIDGVRGLFAKWTGSAGAQPQNINERVQLMDAETRKLQSLAALDAPGANMSTWVADLRGSTRYIIAIMVLLSVIIASLFPQLGVTSGAFELLGEITTAVISFLFGEHVYLKFQGRSR